MLNHAANFLLMINACSISSSLLGCSARSTTANIFSVNVNISIECLLFVC
jgi:hypothetical protein